MHDSISSAEAIRGDLDRIARAQQEIADAVTRVHACLASIPATDKEAPALALEASQLVATLTNAGHGQLLLLLAQADRFKAAGRGGLAPWLTNTLQITAGRARGMTRDARRLAQHPELTEDMTKGTYSPDALRLLSRTHHATVETSTRNTAVTETRALLETEGLSDARTHVRNLEHTLEPTRAENEKAQQTARSFFRMSELENGMCRFDILLDAQRAAVFRTAIDSETAVRLRERQYDGTELPDNVRTTEQINAHALVRLAEVFLNATPEQREAAFNAPTIYYATTEAESGADAPTQKRSAESSLPAGCAETAYGTLIPANAIPAPDAPASHLLILGKNGQPITLDGVELDENPLNRLATPAQRTALAYRDRSCTHPGCMRPAIWALHAHHKIAYSQNGPTTMDNLELLCPEHHTAAHHPK